MDCRRAHVGGSRSFVTLLNQPCWSVSRWQYSKWVCQPVRSVLCYPLVRDGVCSYHLIRPTGYKVYCDECQGRTRVKKKSSSLFNKALKFTFSRIKRGFPELRHLRLSIFCPRWLKHGTSERHRLQEATRQTANVRENNVTTVLIFKLS